MGQHQGNQVAKLICRWELDLRRWGVREETLQKLKQARPDVAMAYHELLNPVTFRYCCRQIRTAVNVVDAEELEHVVVGALAHILYNLANRPERYTFTDRGAVRKYLHGAIRNVCRLMMRQTHTVTMEEEALAGLSVTEMSKQWEYVEAESRRLLATLPEGYARVMWLYLCGYSVAEIAATLQLKEGTVKSRLYRARQMILESSEPVGWSVPCHGGRRMTLPGGSM